jgi:hypothetical protein
MFGVRLCSFALTLVCAFVVYLNVGVAPLFVCLNVGVAALKKIRQIKENTEWV